MKDAASDSYAGLQLFHRMEAKRIALHPVPPRPAYAELNQKLSFLSEKVPARDDNLSDSVKVSSDLPSSDVYVEDIIRDISSVTFTPSEALKLEEQPPDREI